MSYTNYPTTGSTEQQQSPKDNRKLIYGLLIAALLGTWGYVVYDKSKSKETITQLQTQYSNVDSARSRTGKQNLFLSGSKPKNPDQAGRAFTGQLAEVSKLKSEIEKGLRSILVFFELV
jgi:hypothetical protein